MPGARSPVNLSVTADVLLAADMCVDLLLSGNVRPLFHQAEQLIGGYQLELGGSANIFASQLAKLGARVGVIGTLGADCLGEFALMRLHELGVGTGRVRVDPAVRTGLGVALIEADDRAILTYPGSLAAVGPELFPEVLAGACRHWHVASYFLLARLKPIWPEWLVRCRAAGITTSLDPNWDPENRWSGIRDLLPTLDVFLPNEAEALAIVGCLDAREAALALCSAGPTVVVKRGARGIIAAQQGRVWREPALAPVGPVVDSVGAGDNFDAGFMCGWLSGWDLPDCLDLGQRCAVASLTRSGGIEGQVRDTIFRNVFSAGEA